MYAASRGTCWASDDARRDANGIRGGNAVIVRCPTCQAQYRLDAARLRDGRGRLRCARCRNVFPVQAEAEPAPSREPAARLDVALVAAEAGPLRQRVQTALQSLGLRVVLADDGPNALDVSRRTRPRMVAATWYLPHLAGSEVLSAMREEPTLASTRTMLVGGPPRRLRHAVPDAVIDGVDARIGEDAQESEIASIAAALLGGDPSALPLPPEADVRALARVAIQDLKLYYSEEIEAGRRDGRLHPRIAEYLASARAGCIERYPPLRSSPAGLGAWDDEVRLALRRHA